MQKQIKQVEEIMDRHPERLCAECKGTGRVEPSETFKFVCNIAYGRTFGKVRCLQCFGSGYSVPPEQVQ